MSKTTFSGPVASLNGFIAPTYTTVEALALPTDDLVIGTVIYVADGLGGLPTLAIWSGAAWKNSAGATIND
jgi:hypothetical protein